MVVTTLDYRKGEKRHFFSLYNPGQGTYVRWGTVAGAGLIILAGAWWIGAKVLGSYDLLAQTIGVVIWIALGAVLSFYLVNRPNLAEFMIMTESEMRKVTWPARRAVIASTRVVIFMTLLLAVLLWLVDVAFKSLFELMKIL
jgi:preprotein translocase subunit SecE